METERFKKLICFAVALLTLATFLRSERDLSRGGLSFFFDNDVVFNTDQYYTNGIKIQWFSPEFRADVNTSEGQGWVEKLARFLSPLKGKQYSHALSVALVQKMFTSDDITISRFRTGVLALLRNCSTGNRIPEPGLKAFGQLCFFPGAGGGAFLCRRASKRPSQILQLQNPDGVA